MNHLLKLPVCILGVTQLSRSAITIVEGSYHPITSQSASSLATFTFTKHGLRRRCISRFGTTTRDISFFRSRTAATASTSNVAAWTSNSGISNGSTRRFLLPSVSCYGTSKSSMTVRGKFSSSLQLQSKVRTTQDDDENNKLVKEDTTIALTQKAATTRNLNEVQQIAEMAARAAGEIMKKTSGKIEISKTKTNAADLVTESDVECQRVIKEIIQRSFPADLFLGEEDVGAGSEASIDALKGVLDVRNASDDDEDDSEEKLLWVVDPIDGTTNFQAGLPMFCTSIGVVALSSNKQPEIVAGIIYNPILDEMMSAVRGQGCYLNGKLLKRDEDDGSDNANSGGIQLSQALVNVGFPVYSESTLNASSSAVAALATKVRGLRMIASASQVMSWVAQGKFDAYVSWDLNAWDVAAGMVIVEESGGSVCNFDGTKADISSRDMIVACNEGKVDDSGWSLSEELRNVLKENKCLKY